METIDYDFPYRFFEDDIGYTEKQILKMQAKGFGYMPEHNLVKGKLDVEKLKAADLDDELYKGGIENFIIGAKDND